MSISDMAGHPRPVRTNDIDSDDYWGFMGNMTHPDDLAVDSFSREMKQKLAKKRAEGRGGWEDKGSCTQQFLSELLREHVEKGDPVDVANLCMMLQQRGEGIL